MYFCWNDDLRHFSLKSYASFTLFLDLSIFFFKKKEKCKSATAFVGQVIYKNCNR
jgi:hypothetical protein